MATYKFSWSKPATEVFVTGTFDNWAQTQKLEKVGDKFEKTVTLPDSSDKILYKYVVDGNWVADESAPTEADSKGNANNVLTPEAILSAAPPASAILNSVGPEATTVAMAQDAPVSDKPAVPGTFPETPMADLDKQVGINPMPAAPGGLNPIKLAPGEKIPETIAGQDTNSHVKLDPESYEKADTLPGMDTLPPVGKNMIPESSLPIEAANPLVSSVGPQATTVGLAGKVPLEPKVPALVKESQKEAGFPPEASAVAEEVKEKSEVESELMKKVPEAPSTSEGTSGKGTEKSEKDKTVVETVTATVAGLGTTMVATAVATKDTVVKQVVASGAADKLPESVKKALPVSVQESLSSAAKEETCKEVSPEVPAEVKESILEAGKSPEAAANTEAVEKKEAVEAELLKEVKPVAAEGETSKKAETNGAETVPAKEGEPSKAVAKAPESPATKEKKKRNRVSQIFSKIKHNFSSKDKDKA